LFDQNENKNIKCKQTNEQKRKERRCAARAAIFFVDIHQKCLKLVMSLCSG
jgi:hypothetical protein